LRKRLSPKGNSELRACFAPRRALPTLILVFGVCVLVEGILSIVAAVRVHDHRRHALGPVGDPGSQQLLLDPQLEAGVDGQGQVGPRLADLGDHRVVEDRLAAGVPVGDDDPRLTGQGRLVLLLDPVLTAALAIDDDRLAIDHAAQQAQSQPLRNDPPRIVYTQSPTILVPIDGPPVLGFVYTNNLSTYGTYGIAGTGHGSGNSAIGAFLPGSDISRNVIAGGPAANYPPNNSFPSPAQFQTQFMSYLGSDYRLIASSPWRSAGTDGMDLGAPPLTALR
jgi:hypothetical protein